MYRKTLNWILVFVMVFTVFWGISLEKAEALDTYFIDDDFESDTVGELPDGWIIKYNGDGTDKQEIVSGKSVSGDKSLKLDGASSWSATIYKDLPDDLPHNLNVEAYVMPTAPGESGSISLFSQSGSWGTYLARLIFGDEKICYSTTGHDENNLVELQPYTVDTWYHVKLVHDLSSRTFDIYIDGTKRAENVDFYSSYDVDSLVLSSGNASGTNLIYYDDIKVYGDYPPVEVNGDITESTTWTNDRVYHVTTKINVRASLIIEAGTVVKFDENGYIFVREDSGSLTANGTAANPVYFTSIKDDTLGGDTNNDGDATTPSSGDWYGIRNTFGYGMDLEYTEIRYAGKILSFMGMYGSVNNYGNLILSSVSIYNGNQNGIYINDWSDDPAPSTISDCNIYNNLGSGIYINSAGSAHSILNSRIDNNGGCGIRVDNSTGQINIQNNNIKENNLNPLCVNNSDNISLLNNSVEELNATVSPGSSEGTTKIETSSVNGNHIGIQVTKSAITGPNLFDSAPTGQGVTNPYISNDDISGVDSDINKYINVYELNSENLVVRYKHIELTEDDIKPVLETYTVSFNSQGGTNVSLINVTEGDSIETAPSTNRDGYTFDGWFTSSTGGNKISFPFEPIESIILYAQWTNDEEPEESNTTRPSVAKLEIDTEALKDGVENEQYELQVEGDGGKSPYIWSAEGLPKGLSISEEGLIFGVPKEVGDFSIKIELLDSRNYYRSGIFNLIILKSETIEDTEIPEDIVDDINFPDIDNHWSKEYIKELGKKNYINGYPDGTFRPEKKVTREEFASLLVRALQLENYSDTTFEDVVDRWSTEDISIATYYEIIKGYDENKFGPEDFITREQMAVMVARALDLEENRGEVGLNDIQNSSNWARSSIIAVVNEGLIEGYPDGSFRPMNNLTRAEAVKVIYNINK